MNSQQFQKAAANQLKRVRTRALLMDSAIQEFARSGIEKASIDQIVSRAAVSHGTFYYHFSSKREIAEAVGRSVAAALVTLTDQQLLDIESGQERVAMATQLFLISAATIPDWGWLVVHALADMGPFREQISRGIRKDVLLGIRRGEFEAEPSELLFTGMLSVVGAALRLRLENPSEPDIERQAAVLVLMMLGLDRAVATGLIARVNDKDRNSQTRLVAFDQQKLQTDLLRVLQQILAAA